MTNLNLTERQITILGIALTNLYDKIYKSGEGQQMRDDIMEFSRYIQKQHNEENEELANRRAESRKSLDAIISLEDDNCDYLDDFGKTTRE